MALPAMSEADIDHLVGGLKLTPVQRTRLKLMLSASDPSVLKFVLAVMEGRRSEDELYATVYVEPEPPLDEFLYGSRYLNLPTGAIYPRIFDLLVEVDKPETREAWLCCGKGSGKSTVVSCVMARGVHRLVRCLRDPSAYYRLMPGDKIGIVNMSVSSKQANDVVFGKFLRLLEKSTCFWQAGMALYHRTKTRIEFPTVHVLSGHSNYRAYYGYNVYIGVIDEMSWFLDTSNNPVGEEVYQGMLAAATTRFGDDYKLVCVSTPKSQDDPLYRRVDDGIRNGVPIVSVELEGDAGGVPI